MRRVAILLAALLLGAASPLPREPGPSFRRPPLTAAETVRLAQRDLNRAGYHAGPVDGIAGRRTMAAIHSWRRHHGLPAGSAVDSVLLDSLQAGVVAALEGRTREPQVSAVPGGR